MGSLDDFLSTVWSRIASGDTSWNPDRSIADLVEEYGKSGRTQDESVRNFIDWQTAKSGGVGFLLGLPGMAFAGVTIPADLVSTTYLQLRMVAVIASIYGWDIKSDRVRTAAFLCLLGGRAADAIRGTGVHIGNKVAFASIKRLPISILHDINKKVGFRLLTKAGSTGVVNLTKLVPLVGGLVSGGLNIVSTRRIGWAADAMFRHGPVIPNGGTQVVVVK